MTNSTDPDQLASSEANWSGSTLFAKTGRVVFSKRRANISQKIKSNPKYENRLIQINLDSVATGSLV